MHREDESKYLLFIEPKKKERLTIPVEDSLTSLVREAVRKGEVTTSKYSDLNDEGTYVKGSTYKGYHLTDCGESSTNYDILLENGMITNSIAEYYVKWYRNSIPETEIIKLMNLKKYYEQN